VVALDNLSRGRVENVQGDVTIQLFDSSLAPWSMTYASTRMCALAMSWWISPPLWGVKASLTVEATVQVTSRARSGWRTTTAASRSSCRARTCTMEARDRRCASARVKEVLTP
jgi:hypothetical protein